MYISNIIDTLEYINEQCSDGIPHRHLILFYSIILFNYRLPIVTYKERRQGKLARMTPARRRVIALGSGGRLFIFSLCYAGTCDNS